MSTPNDDPLTRALLSLQSAITSGRAEAAASSRAQPPLQPSSAAAPGSARRKQPRKSELSTTQSTGSLGGGHGVSDDLEFLSMMDFDEDASAAAAAVGSPGDDQQRQASAAAAARHQLSSQLLSTGRMKQTGGRSAGQQQDVRASDLLGMKKFSGHMLWLRVQKARLAAGSEAAAAGGVGGGNGGGGGGGGFGGDFVGGDFGSEQQVDKRKLQQLWSYLPDKEKRQWNAKASRLMRQAARIGQRSFGAAGAAGAALSPRQLAGHRAGEAVKRLAGERRRLQLQMEKGKLGRFTALDVAAHLKLLGDSLQALGLRLQRGAGATVSHAGSLAVVTDSLLCSLVCLHCLATQVPGIAEAVDVAEAADSLDNCAFFMPGLAGTGGGGGH